MTNLAWGLLLLTFAVALVDWFAVARAIRPLEYAAKPLTMVALGAVALALEPADASMRGWFVIALLCSLAGDVFLMLDPPERFFVPGLASFLVGHVAYIVGLAAGGVSTGGALVGVVLVFLALASFGPTIVQGAVATDARLGVPVSLYMAAIGTMVTLAFGSTVPLAVAGALLFFASDFAIGWSRFVGDFAGSRLFIIVTYHLGQVGLVLSLTRPR